MGTTGIANVGNTPRNVEAAPLMDGYSGVRIIIGTNESGENITYESGSMSGNVLEFENPFGSQEMADDVLARIQGYQYQPIIADGALLDPAAELGDGVSAAGIYSGIYRRDTTYNVLMASDVAAPGQEEVIHEYNVETESERKFRRFEGETKAQIAINSQEIDAKVSKVSPEGQSTFGWNLTDSEWTVYNENGTILTASSEGLSVKGKIEADEGYIGGANGFVITASAIYNAIDHYGDTETEQGVYIGTDGIQLGKNFLVNSFGQVTASDLRLRGGQIYLGEEDEERSVTASSVDVDFYGGTYVDGSQHPIYYVFDGTFDLTTYVLDPDSYERYLESLLDFDLSPYVLNSSQYDKTIADDKETITFKASYLEGLDEGTYYAIIYRDGYGEVGPPDCDFTKSSHWNAFSVSTTGAVTATSLTILGGSININNEFMVDPNGNLMANTGTFKGAVYAGGIEWGDDAGYFDGEGILDSSIIGGFEDDFGNYIGAINPGTVDVGAVSAAINTALGDGIYAANACLGIEACGVLDCQGIMYQGYPTGVISFTISGTTYNCIGWTSEPI